MRLIYHCKHAGSTPARELAPLPGTIRDVSATRSIFVLIETMTTCTLEFFLETGPPRLLRTE
jgi:hypothetical protein